MTITLVNDEVNEPQESFSVSLSSLDMVQFSNQTLTVTINDDDMGMYIMCIEHSIYMAKVLLYKCYNT